MQPDIVTGQMQIGTDGAGTVVLRLNCNQLVIDENNISFLRFSPRQALHFAMEMGKLAEIARFEEEAPLENEKPPS